ACDLERLLVGASHDDELIGRLDRSECVLEIVRVDDGLASRRHDQVTDLDPGLSGGTAVLDAADQDAVTLRQADRASEPTRDVIRRDGHTEARSLDGLAFPQGVEAAAERRIGRQREIETLADPVRVQPDEPTLAVEQRPARRAGSEGRRMLDAAGDPPSTGAAERARHRRHEADRDARAATIRCSGAEHGITHRRVAGTPFDGLRSGRLDRDHREIAVAVDAADLAAGRSPIGEGDGDFSSPEVVGVRQDLTVSDDDARPATVPTDTDDRWADALRDRRDRATEFLEAAHPLMLLAVMCVRE